MIRKILILASSVAISAANSFGGWTVVDDFEGYADTAALAEAWTQDVDPDGSGGGGVLADDDGNNVLQFNMGLTEAETGTYNVRLYRSIPNFEPASGVKTFYFRFGVPSVMDGSNEVPGVIDVVWGLSPVDDPTAYGDYGPLGRQEFNQSFDLYNLDTYVELVESLPGNTWYEMWWVVDTDTRKVSVYMKGGDTYATQTLVAEDYGWRNQTTEALDRFLLTSSAGTLIDPKGLDAMLIDDIYVDLDGENLQTPSTGSWALIDDFSGYADQAALEMVWTQDDDPDGSGGGGVLADDDGNDVLQFNMGLTEAETGTYNVRLYRAIPDIAPASGKTTFYFKFGVPSVMDGSNEVPGVIDVVWGLSPVDDPTAYGDYGPLGRQEFNQSFDLYNLDTYVELVESLPGNTWYEMWWVVDTDTRKVSVYMKGGDTYATQTLVAEDYGWRNQTTEALDRFLLTSSAGTLIDPKGLDAMLFDDLYISAGSNLTTPGEGGVEPLPPGDAEFFNISTRGAVGTGGNILIGGFVVKGVPGTETGTVLIRAIGPGLADLGVGGTLVDPVLEIYNSANPPELVYSNDDWGVGADSDAAQIKSASATVGAFPIADGSKDAVLLLALPPGNYTAQVSGKDGTTGVAIIEVYAVD